MKLVRCSTAAQHGFSQEFHAGGQCEQRQRRRSRLPDRRCSRTRSLLRDRRRSRSLSTLRDRRCSRPRSLLRNRRLQAGPGGRGSGPGRRMARSLSKAGDTEPGAGAVLHGCLQFEDMQGWAHQGSAPQWSTSILGAPGAAAAPGPSQPVCLPQGRQRPGNPGGGECELPRRKAVCTWAVVTRRLRVLTWVLPTPLPYPKGHRA